MATIRLADKFVGPVRMISGLCCGMNSYLHGSLEDARSALSVVIAKYEEICGDQPLPLVTDCGECAAFFRRAEQIFAEDPIWRPRAKAFAAAARDSLEIVPPERCGFLLSSSETALSGRAKARVTFHENASAAHWQKCTSRANRTLSVAFGERFAPMRDSQTPCGAEFGFPLFSPDEADRMLRLKITAIAETRADIVVSGSHNAVAYIAAGLKKYYPHCEAVHYTVLLDEVLNGRSGRGKETATAN